VDEVTLIKRCAVCPESIVYQGPRLLQNARVYCDETCARIDDVLLPGQWYDAAEMMQGGRFHDRPDLWLGPAD
jgi:hypothetical protein